MRVIFSRHGNTFDASMTPVWVGANQDLPLVTTGIQQAKQLAEAIRSAKIMLSAVYCGPLKRTRDYANVVIDTLELPFEPIVDNRLNELDYGNWTGLSSTQIKENGDGEALTAWENFSKWPQNAAWSASPELIISEVRAFAELLCQKHQPTDTILVITSNGRLRYFLELIPGAFAKHVDAQNFKVMTGNVCMCLHKQDKWQVEFWNQKPKILVADSTQTSTT